MTTSFSAGATFSFVATMSSMCKATSALVSCSSVCDASLLVNCCTDASAVSALRVVESTVTFAKPPVASAIAWRVKAWRHGLPCAGAVLGRAGNVSRGVGTEAAVTCSTLGVALALFVLTVTVSLLTSCSRRRRSCGTAAAELWAWRGWQACASTHEWM